MSNLDKILRDGFISSAFKARGFNTFKEACKGVRSFDYQRNSTKKDPLIVLKESCGTCSSKHELLKRLAEENEMTECNLVLCIFKMSGENTPKVKSILDAYGLDFIPEAHTYITIYGEVHDFTFPDNPKLLFLKDVMYTEPIAADQIRTYKEQTHKSFLKTWQAKNDLAYGFEELWSIREECIAALAE